MCHLTYQLAKRPKRLQMSVARGFMDRRPACVIGRIEIGPPVREILDHAHVTSCRCGMQGRPSDLVLHVDVHAFAERISDPGKVPSICIVPAENSKKEKIIEGFAMSFFTALSLLWDTS